MHPPPNDYLWEDYETLLQPIAHDLGKRDFRYIFESALWVYGKDFSPAWFDGDDVPQGFNNDKDSMWPNKLNEN